jgi:hypothetical protein
MPSRNKIAFVLIFTYALLLFHNTIPHHHFTSPEECLNFITDNHYNNKHPHFFSEVHTTHRASSASEIIHIQYQQSRPINQIALIPVILPEKPEFIPPELHHILIKSNQCILPIIEGTSLACGLRAPPIA